MTEDYNYLKLQASQGNVLSIYYTKNGPRERCEQVVQQEENRITSKLFLNNSKASKAKIQELRHELIYTH